MTVAVIIGSQFGDEGKGKVTDFYAAESDMIVRFNGGNNAGHTIVVGEDIYKLHLMPSGAIQPNKHVVIGNGVVVDPGVLLQEMAELEAAGHPVSRLSVSDRAHLILSYHKLLDGIEEDLKGKLKAGTTMRGIGPAYQDKAARWGVRAGDLLDKEELRRKLDIVLPIKERTIRGLGGPDVHFDTGIVYAECLDYAERLSPYIEDTTVLINDAIEEGKNVLFEGAQGVLLDIDHGVYPFGTSSNVVTGAACTGAGVAPSVFDEVIGIVKAYLSRVGTGPVPTELEDEAGKHLQTVGNEFGATTGRPRRCGWLDLAMVRYSHMLCGFTGIALTKVDVLSDLPKVKVCTAYKARGRNLKVPPADMALFAECEPQYVELEGWEDPGKEAWRRAAREGMGALPSNCRRYVEFVEEELGVPVAFLGVGPGRSETLDLRGGS
ncbi:MAG: adenylosuccinate synthase [Thermoplasmata archaeon]|nr:adenylosuccinate synthase [Thermoplasmata archaeon]